MTGADLKRLRNEIGDKVLGRRLSLAETAKLCGLAPANGADTIRKWEDGDGPSGPVANLLEMYAVVIDRDASKAMRDAMTLQIRRKIQGLPTTLAR